MRGKTLVAGFKHGVAEEFPGLHAARRLALDEAADGREDILVEIAAALEPARKLGERNRICVGIAGGKRGRSSLAEFVPEIAKSVFARGGGSSYLFCLYYYLYSVGNCRVRCGRCRCRICRCLPRTSRTFCR